MRSRLLLVPPLVSLLTLAACGAGDGGAGSGDAAPAREPTWFGGVQALVRDNCASCHGAVPFSEAVAAFRLDRYVKNDEQSFDAYDYRDLIIAYAAELQEPVMPPGAAMGESERQLLRDWLAAGAPKGERGNSAPTAVLLDTASIPDSVDQELTLAFRSEDADGDGLVVQVGYRDEGGVEHIVNPSLPAGDTSILVDTGQLVSQGSFTFFVRLDDGYSDDPTQNQTEVVLADSLLVDHGERGTAPTVSLLSPNGGDTLIGSTQVQWEATDPDPGDVLTIDIELLELDSAGAIVATTALASGLPSSPAAFDWNPEGIATATGEGTPIPYKIRVTATDQGDQNARSDESDLPFTLAQGGGNTSLSWDDVRPIFVTYCGECHGQPAKSAALESFRMDKYDADDPAPPANDDPGVFEMSGAVYQRMVVQANMPPQSSPQPSAEDIAAIDEWILAGAPEGPDSGGNQPPLFSWITPNDNATTSVNNASVTLEWSTSDPEGQPLSGSILMAELPNGIPPLNPMTASCNGSEAGYAEVVGSANIEDGSANITLPNSGFFCFKAEITDGGTPALSATATRPINF